MIESERVTIVELGLPADTNHHGTLFGGTALSLMDRAGFVAATRHVRRALVTVATDNVNFRAPVEEGDLVEVSARVVETGRSSVVTEIELVGEKLLTGERRLAARARFVYVAVDEHGRPTPLAE